MRDEPSLPAAMQHRVVDRRVTALVCHERLVAQVGHRHDGLNREAVIDEDGEYERLDVDGPQLDVFADRGRP